MPVSEGDEEWRSDVRSRSGQVLLLFGDKGPDLRVAQNISGAPHVALPADCMMDFPFGATNLSPQVAALAWIFHRCWFSCRS